MYYQNYVVKRGENTPLIYSLIKEERHAEVLPILKNQLVKTPNSRSCLSLLGYCYYHIRDFTKAAKCYEKLAEALPKEQIYNFYYAQCLYKNCKYEKALRTAGYVHDEKCLTKVLKLKAAIKFAQDDLISAQVLLDKCVPVNRDVDINQGCIFLKEKKYVEAIAKFKTALAIGGFNPQLSYNMALCYYRLKDYPSASKYIADIMERGIEDHPELGIGSATDGFEIRSVGNTPVLEKSGLIEAFNLKAAIEYQLHNLDAAKEALIDMPPRLLKELDAVTLHNQAILYMDVQPAMGFEKLRFLLHQGGFPDETLSNLLLLYCKYEHFNLVADCLAECSHFMHKYINQYLFNFFDAMIILPTSSEEAYKKLDVIGNRHIENLRKATKRVQEARANQDDQGVKNAISDYEETLESYIPILMAQAKIYWDLERYDYVEKIFHKSAEFCSENDTWRLHVANVLFMQDNKYKEASGFYEVIIKKHYNNLLNVSAIVLANLCVSYIMTAMNEEAEELMRKIEKEEERLHYEEPNKKVFHLSIVNLVIGTLYCAKGNYEFGISRLIRSFEPYNKKLGTETWFYAKRCILSLIENIAKRIVFANDIFYRDCIEFLDQCEGHGQNIKTIIVSPLEEDVLHEGKQTVMYEARLLKALLMRSTITKKGKKLTFDK